MEPAAQRLLQASRCEWELAQFDLSIRGGGRLARRWQHLHFFQFKAFIEARVPRVACSQCNKTSQCEVPWSRPGSGFSAVMEAFVIALCQGMPVAQVARLLGVSDERVWRVLEHYIPKARTEESMTSMSKLAVDETSSRRGAFISVFFAGSLLIEVIFSLDGLGLMSFEAAINRDYPVVFGTLFIFTLLGLVVKLIGDITYTLVDPRIDFESRES